MCKNVLILILNRETSHLNQWILKKTKEKVKVTGTVTLIVDICSHTDNLNLLLPGDVG